MGEAGRCLLPIGVISRLLDWTAMRGGYEGPRRFNMSRTLSIDKIGPGPGFLGQALPLSQPSCGDLGVSLRRSSLQFNIRPWRISALGNPLLRLGLPRSIRQSRVAGGALGARRKRAWG